MSQSIPIPGGYAVFRENLKVRQRRLIETAGIQAVRALGKLPNEVTKGEIDPTTVALDALDLSDSEADSIFFIQDAAILAYLESWTLDRPLPTKETIGDLEVELYDALVEGARKVQEKAPPVVNFATTSPKDTDSPFSSSELSNGHSQGVRESLLTTKSETSGESIDIVSFTVD